MKINITLKIIGVVTLLFLLLFIIILSNNISSYETDLTNYFIERAKSTTYSLEAGIKSAEGLQKKDELMSGIQKLMWLDPEIIDITYVMPGKDGLVNYVSNDPRKVDAEPDPENFEAYEKKILITSIYNRDSSRVLKIVSPLHLSGQVIGTVQLDFTMENVDKKILSAVSTLTIGYFMLMVLFIMVLFFFLRMIIIKPIMKISKGVEAIAKSDLDYNVDIKSRDEIGNLSRTFNQMTQDLKIYQNQIKKHQEELEQKVVDRTKELDEKIKDLTDMKTAILNMMDDMDDANRELIKTQEELTESLLKLKETDIKKDQFISIAAHELKTPLTSIHGFSQLLQNKAIIKDVEKRNKYLNIMDHETDRLAKLVTDILDLSRIDLGTLKLAIEEIDLSEFMDGIQKEMNVQMKQKGLASEYDMEKGLPKITTDREKLMEIMINLINNSVKYTPSGKITVKVFREKENVHFMVKDTGIGIAKEHHAQIFERFYQVDSSYTRSAGGVGLGLSLCQEFVNALGGKIWFSSEHGKGSEFHFTLPVKNVTGSAIKDEKAKAEEVLERSKKITAKGTRF